MTDIVKPSDSEPGKSLLKHEEHLTVTFDEDSNGPFASTIKRLDSTSDPHLFSPSLLADAHWITADVTQAPTSNPDREFLNRISPYIPAWPQQMIRNNITSERIRGAFLFIDVSGFTEMTLTFSKLAGDAVGGEMLSACLSRYFQSFTAPLISAGGEVIKFAGDAVLVVFRAERFCDFRCTVARAAAAGFHAVSMMTNVALSDITFGAKKRNFDFYSNHNGGGGDTPLLSHSGEDSPLCLLKNHAAISCGELIGTIVGDMSRKEFVVAGNCLSEMGPALDIAEVKSLVCTTSVVEILSTLQSEDMAFSFDQISPKYFKVNSAPSPLVFQMPLSTGDTPSKKVVDLDPNELKPFVPAAVFEYLSSKTLQFIKMAELRTVTVLFLQVGVGCQVPPALMVNWLQQTSYVVLKKLRRSGGELRQIIVDDKGAVVIGVFGLPHMPVDDKNRCRELKAAASISAKLSLLMIPHAIGLATGRAFCGIIEGSGHKEFVVMGRVVILSARLMAKMAKFVAEIEEDHWKGKRQHGDLLPILCCEETFKAMYHPEDHGLELIANSHPMKLKGFEDPIQGYRAAIKTNIPHLMHQLSNVSEESSTSTARLQFFFRDSSSEACETKPGTTLLIYGSPGSGKSVLMEEIVWKIRGKSLENAAGVLVCSCCAGHKNVSLWQLRKMVIEAATKFPDDFSFDVKLMLKSHQNLVTQLNVLKRIGYLKKFKNAFGDDDDDDDDDEEENTNNIEDLGSASNNNNFHLNDLQMEREESSTVNLLMFLLKHYCQVGRDMIMRKKKRGDAATTGVDVVGPIIVVEDVQWCDRESLQVLPFLAAKLPSTFVICTLRPSMRCTKIREKFAKFHAKEIVLKKVSDRSIIANIAATMLRVDRIDEALLDKIVELGDMSPTYTVDLCKHYLRHKLIEIDQENNCARLVPDATREQLCRIPFGIEKTLMVRFSELNSVQLHILKLASVLGRNFLFSDLAAMNIRVQTSVLEYHEHLNINHQLIHERLKAILGSLCDMLILIREDKEKYSFYDKHLFRATQNMLSTFDQTTFRQVYDELKGEMLQSDGSDDGGLVENNCCMVVATNKK